MRRQQHPHVPLAGVPSEAVHQHPTGGDLGQEERLIDPDAFALITGTLVDRPLGQPGGEVEQLHAERLGVGPVLTTDGVLGQGQTGHGEHGQPVVAHLRVGVGTLVRDEQRHAFPHLVEEVGDHNGVLVVLGGITAQHLEHLSGMGIGPPTHRTDRTEQHDAGLGHPGDFEREHAGEHVEHQPAPGGGSQRLLPPPGPLRVVLIEEMAQLRLGDDPIRIEDAGLGVEQIDRPGVGPQLRQLTQLGQRA